MNLSVSPLRPVSATLTQSSFPFFAVLYAALFGAFGTESPFLPSFLASRALSPPEIGFVLAAGTVVRLSLGPFLGVAGDRFGSRRILGFAAAAAGTVGLSYVFASGFWLLLTISMLHSLATAPLSPLADALALAASARERVFAYGWVRGIGSAAFVLGTLVSGQFVAHYGLASIIIASSVLFLLMIPPIFRLRPVASPGTASADGAIKALLTFPLFRRTLLVAGLVIGSHAMSDTFAVIHWRAAGIGPGLISLLLAEAAMSEVVVFVGIGPVLLRRLTPAGCAASSAVAGIVRWAVLASTTNVEALAFSELLHGLTFSLMHLACMQVIATVIPERLSATAQTLYGTLCLGLASALITFASGELYGSSGPHAFFLMSGLCLVALLLSLQLRSRA